MLGLRLNPPRPFWFEDLVFFALDEGRRIPGRAKGIASRINNLARAAWQANAEANFTGRMHAFRAKFGATAKAQPEIRTKHVEAELLDEPLSWTLATEPLVAVGTGTEAAIALHKAASEQLDALTYVLDRMRDELRPLMNHTQLDQTPVHQLHNPAELETSIEALLELSRQNAATRPKNRALTAA